MGSNAHLLSNVVVHDQRVSICRLDILLGSWLHAIGLQDPGLANFKVALTFDFEDAAGALLLGFSGCLHVVGVDEWLTVGGGGEEHLSEWSLLGSWGCCIELFVVVALDEGDLEELFVLGARQYLLKIHIKVCHEDICLSRIQADPQLLVEHVIHKSLNLRVHFEIELALLIRLITSRVFKDGQKFLLLGGKWVQEELV